MFLSGLFYSILSLSPFWCEYHVILVTVALWAVVIIVVVAAAVVVAVAETEPLCVAQAGFGFKIPLLQLCKCRDYKHTPPHLIALAPLHHFKKHCPSSSTCWLHEFWQVNSSLQCFLYNGGNNPLCNYCTCDAEEEIAWVWLHLGLHGD